MSNLLNIEAAGLKAEANGKFIINENDETNVPHIYAVGDAVYGRPELTPVAIDQGKLLAKRLYMNSALKINFSLIPTTIFTPLEYGSVGLTEEDAKAKYGADNIKTWHTMFTPLEWKFNPMRKGEDCYVKYLENTADGGRIVGFHLIAPNAADNTQFMGLSMKLGVTHDIL